METILNLRVKHHIYGEGIIVDHKHHNHEYLIRFPNNLKLWLRKSSVTPLEHPKQLSNEIIHKDRQKRVDGFKPIMEPRNCTKDERSVIEAFRLGIVPSQAIRDWTFGRTNELDMVKQWLNDESSGTMVIKGEYGSGKSHLIEYLHANAFSLNYAVSFVAIDPCDAQPGFPKRVYRHIMRNLRFPYNNQYVDFYEIMTNIGKSAKENPLSNHPFLGDIFKKVIEDKDTPEMWEWIEGQETSFSGMGTLYDHTTAANIYCNILSSIGTVASRILNLKGVLLLFDEAEVSRTYRYTYEWNRAVNFFNALSMVANDEPELKTEQVVRGNAYYYGNKTGLIYSGHLRIPYIHQLPSFLKVVFAFTPDFNLKLYQDYNIYEIELKALPQYQMELLFLKFADLYEEVYSLSIPQLYRRRLFKHVKAYAANSTRKFIKAMVECLDFYRFYPHGNPEKLF